MHGLNCVNGSCNGQCYFADYRLFNKKIYDLRVDRDFLKINNCFSKLIWICKPKNVIKSRKSGSYYSRSSFKHIKK